MTLLVLVVVITVFISAHCSLFESTLFSTRTGTLEACNSSGHKENLAKKFLEMKRNIALPIAPILILNTLANTAGATFAGLYAAEALGPSRVPRRAPGIARSETGPNRRETCMFS
ncbi:MAG: DUF21 domain-containing protein [Desulfomonilaceae bacterium]|nr:DUF21 domain-containing protein [Desulfomonilaceae bacterium]